MVECLLSLFEPGLIIGGSGGVRGYKNRGERSSPAHGEDRELANDHDRRAVCFLKTDSGDAGSKGEANVFSESGLPLGGERKGLQGDIGDGVSGSQYERGGTGGMSKSILPAMSSDVVPG
ncbi:hypothetical protein PMIN06_009078 [Paraphaeosphaeria minitans]